MAVENVQDNIEGTPSGEPDENLELNSADESASEAEGELQGEPTEEFDEISAERYNDLLDIERRHKEQAPQYGKAINEVGELRKQLDQAKLSSSSQDNSYLKEDDYDDPAKITKTINKIADGLKEVQNGGTGMTREDVQQILLQERAVGVIDGDPVLKSMGYDESGYPRAMGLIREAASWALQENKRLGQEKYQNPKSAWEGFKKSLAGGNKQSENSTEKTRKAIIRQVRSGGPTVEVGETTPTTSVVDEYKKLLETNNPKKVADFVKSLKPEERKKVNALQIT